MSVIVLFFLVIIVGALVIGGCVMAWNHRDETLRRDNKELRAKLNNLEVRHNLALNTLMTIGSGQSGNPQFDAQLTVIDVQKREIA